MMNMVQNDPKVAYLLKSENVCCLLQYIDQYNIRVKLSYIFGFLTSIQLHAYITHTHRLPIQVVEQPRKHPFFLQRKLTCVALR